MERRIAKDFNEKVHALIPEESDREKLYSALGNFQREHDLKQLVSDLKKIINEPNLIPLYESIRKLIPLKYQIQYDRVVPRKPTDKLRVIRLHRKNSEGLGFAVRGGLEHGVGIHVSRVVADSQAEEQGLRVGDEIVRLNGFTISQAIHDEVLNLIKSKTELVLKVRNIGMIPVKENSNEKLSWQYVNPLDANKALQQVLEGESVTGDQTTLEGEEVKLFINLPLHVGLGCSVCSGPPEKPGIFIQSVQARGLAVEAGLEVGDQIISCNDTSFFNISHSQAIVALKGSRQLEMVIKKRAGGEFFGPRKRILSEEEDKAKKLQLLITEKQREQEGKSEKYKKNEPSKRKYTAKKDKELDETLQDAEFDQMSFCQEDLIHQALQAMEEKEMKKKAEMPSSSKNDATKELDSPQYAYTKARRSSQALDVLVDQPISKPPPLVVSRGYYNHKRQFLSSPENESPVYMSDERAPSFRFQKPVMLHPDSKSADKKSPGASIPEEADLLEELSEENFNPHRMFTNEQIAGRQIKLVTVIKEGSKDFGMMIESSAPTLTSSDIIVAEICEGSILHKQGGIHVGDQLMLVDQKSLLNVTVAEAQTLLREAFHSDQAVLQLVIAKAPPSDLGEEVTYF